MSDEKAGLGARIGSFLSDWGSNIAKGSGITGTATKSAETGTATNNGFNALGALMGSTITSAGGDQNAAQGISTAISQAPDMFKAIKNFDASSFKAGLGSSMNIAGIAGNVLGAFADDRKSLSGEYGQLSKNAEMVADTVLSSIPGFGQAYAAINGVSDFLAGKYDNLSTAGSTKSDAIMDAIPLLGLANAAAGKEMNKLDYDTEAWNTVGSSYAGSQKSVKDASDNTGGRYGWLSTVTGEYQKDLAQNLEAERQQTMVSKISDEATENSQIASSTLQEATMNQQKKLQGQGFTFRVQKGMKLPTKQDIQKTKQLFKEPEFRRPSSSPNYSILFREGGKTQNKEDKPKTRSLEELIQYAKEQNPRFIQRLSEPPHGIEFIDDDGNIGVGNVLLEWSTDENSNAVIYPRIQEMEDKSLKFLDKNEAWRRAIQNKNYLVMSTEEAQVFFAEDPEFQTAYKRGWPEMFINYRDKLKFKEGGKMNIIPEGELHARLHHMEQDGITKKGIPVISIEEGGEVVQHAEIERNEIIFHLELTKKLEELMEDGSDEAAIEAGKLLVDEILNNTEDRTGLLNEVE